MITELITTVKAFNVGNTQLRVFGAFLSFLFVVFYVWHTASVLLLLFAVAATLLALLAPRQYLPLVKLLIALTYPIGWIISRVLLVFFYLMVLTPVGILMRLFSGKRWSVTEQASYWDNVEENVHHDRMSL